MKSRFFVIEIEDANNQLSTWELLTLNGKTPDEDLYYPLCGMPSESETLKIDEKIENRDWKEVWRDYNEYTNKTDAELLDQAKTWTWFEEPWI